MIFLNVRRSNFCLFFLIRLFASALGVTEDMKNVNFINCVFNLAVVLVNKLNKSSKREKAFTYTNI